MTLTLTVDRSVRCSLVATLRADFAVNNEPAARATLVVWRLGQAGHRRRDVTGFVLRRAHGVLDTVWTQAVVGAVLSRSVRAGGSLRLPHGGRGVVVHPTVTIGSNVTLYHQVTLGVRNDAQGPVVSDGAYVGAGAKVLGPVTVGPWASVGANAVVVRDVPGGQTWVGIPAQAVTSRSRTTTTAGPGTGRPGLS